MSNWTHVAAVVRVDSFRFGNETEQDAIEKFHDIFGKECLFESSSEVWEDMECAPGSYLPMGSEGSLRLSVWTNPNTSSMAAWTVSIFGDLRDHDDPDEIVNWFKEKIEGLSVRQATITVRNEMNGTCNWTYEDED